MDDDTCRLDLTSETYVAIQQCEAVVVREYKLADDSRVAKIVAWGDVAEMQDAADTRGIFIVGVGVKIIGQTMVLVSDLLPQTDQQGNE